MKNTRLIILLLAIISGSCFAGGYVGLGVGASTYDVDLGAATSLADDSDTGIKAYLGYMIYDFLGLEAGYADLGNFSAAPASLLSGDASAKYFSIIGRTSFTALGLFAKLGLDHRQMDWDSNTLGLSKDSETSGYYGLGFDFNLPKIGLRVEWEHFSSEQKLLSAGLYYRF